MHRLLLATAVSGLVVATAVPADAHPFGPPPTALVTAHGDTVVIEWQSAPDDALAVGVEIGLATEDMVDAYLEAETQAAPPGDVERTLSAADELRDYLTDHVVVRQDGQRCDAAVEPIGNFVWEGATVTHRCPAEIDEVTVEISMLHDRHPAYRTFALAPASAEPPQAVFTGEDDVQRWDLSAALGETIEGDPDSRLADVDEAAAGRAGGDGGVSAWAATAAPVVALVGGVAAASGTVAWRNRRRRSGRARGGEAAPAVDPGEQTPP